MENTESRMKQIKKNKTKRTLSEHGNSQVLYRSMCGDCLLSDRHNAANRLNRYVSMQIQTYSAMKRRFLQRKYRYYLPKLRR